MGSCSADELHRGLRQGTLLAPRSNTDGVEPVRLTDARPPVLAKGELHGPLLAASPISVVQGTSPAEILAQLKRLSGGPRIANWRAQILVAH